MQSVPITTDIVCSNLDQGEVYNIMWSSCSNLDQGEVYNIMWSSCSNLDQGEVYNIMWSSLSVTCGRSVVFSGSPVSFTNKTDRHDITEILLKVALNTIKQTHNYVIFSNILYCFFT
jgi:hypothetical protein